MKRLSSFTIAAALLILGGPVGAHSPAAPGAKTRTTAVTIREIAVPLKGRNWGESGIVAGPDGAMWFTAVSGDGKGTLYGSAIVRVSMDEKFRVYPLGRSAGPGEIAVGSDGALWFTESSAIGRITTGGAITQFAVPANYGSPTSITLGRDGNIWFTAGPGIGRITPAGRLSQLKCTAHDCFPYEITTGSDGALWTTDLDYGLDRFSPTAPSSSLNLGFPREAGNSGLTTGPDGALWICEYVDGTIARYPIGGKPQFFPIPGGGQKTPNQITVGSDGALWFTSPQDGEVDRIDTSGNFERYTAPVPYAAPSYIAAGPDRALWFTDSNMKEIGRIVLR